MSTRSRSRSREAPIAPLNDAVMAAKTRQEVRDERTSAAGKVAFARNGDRLTFSWRFVPTGLGGDQTPLEEAWNTWTGTILYHVEPGGTGVVVRYDEQCTGLSIREQLFPPPADPDGDVRLRDVVVTQTARGTFTQRAAPHRCQQQHLPDHETNKKRARRSADQGWKWRRNNRTKSGCLIISSLLGLRGL